MTVVNGTPLVDGPPQEAVDPSAVQAGVGVVEAPQPVDEDRELRRAVVMHLLTLERSRRRRPGRRGQPPMYRPGR